MTDNVSGDDVTFPPDYWTNQSFYAKDAEGRSDEIRKKSIATSIDAYLESPNYPLSPEDVKAVWENIQIIRDTELDDEANSREISLTKIVLEAIANDRCVDPAICAEIVSDFSAYPA